MKRKISIGIITVMLVNMLLATMGSAAGVASFSITTMFPAHGSKGVSVDTNAIQLQFDRDVKEGAGAVEVFVDGSTTPLVTKTITPQGYVIKALEILIPAGTLAYNTVYHVKGSAGAFVDASNNAVASEEFDLSFTTLSAAGSTAPVLRSTDPFIPVKGTMVEGANQEIKLFFNKAIYKGTGYLYVNRTATNESIRISVQDAVINNDGTTSSYTAAFQVNNLLPGERYYVLIDKGAFKDIDDHMFAGIDSAQMWYFNVKGAQVAWDSTTPHLPVSNASNVPVAGKINLLFNRPVYPNMGDITLELQSIGSIHRIPVTSSSVKGGGTNSISIIIPTLDYNTSYTVTVPAGAFKDSDGNNTSAQSWLFKTATSTSSALTLSTLSPRDRSTGVAVGSTLTATFNRNIAVIDGSKVLLKQSSGTVIPADVSYSGNQLKIDPRSNLQAGTTYFVDIASGAVVDAATGANYVGLSGASNWTFQTESSDSLAPLLQIASMYSNSVIRLQYNESLDSSIGLLTSSFTVSVNGETRRLNNAYVSGNYAYVSLETGVAVGQRITISYSGGVRPIKDLAGNSSASFSAKEVTNGVASVLPKPQDGYVSGNSVTLFFSEDLEDVSTYAYRQFRVTANGSSKSINSISQSGATIILNLSSSVTDNAVVKVSYSPGSYPLIDQFGQKISAFSDYYVRNYSDTKAPDLVKVEGSGSKIVLTYNEALDVTSIPMKSQFSVLVNNSPLYVTNVEIMEDQVILTLASSFAQTQAVTLSYVSGIDGIADLNGNLAGSVNLNPVTYGTVTEGIRSATVSGDTITVTYNTTLMPLSFLPVNQFYVTVDQTNRGLQSASISGDTLTLKLTSAVTPTQAVKLSYMTGAAPLYDYLGNILKSYSDIPVQNLTGTGTNTPGTGGANGQPSYLTTLAATDYGKAGFVLGSGAAQVSGGSTQHGQIVNKYTLDNAKLQESFKYLANNNVNSRMLVFEVPSSEKAALVAAPMAGFMDLYNSGKTGSFAVKYGNVLYEVPVEKIPYAELSRSLMADTLNSVNLLIELETVSRNQLPSAGATGSVTITPLADPVQVSVSAFNTSSPQNDVDVSHKGQIHYRLSGQASVADQASLVKYDVTNRTMAHLPSSTTGSGGTLLFEGTTSGNALIGPAIGYSYFTDTTKHWAKNDIAELTNKLIASPRSSGSNFEPDKSITRAEFAVFIAMGLGLAGDEANARRFPDVSSGTMAAYIGAAAKAGIINGNADGTFKPNSNITREQMALMMVRAMEYAGYDTSMNGASTATLTKFKDAAKIQSKDTVAKAVKEGIIQGVTTNTFQPQGNATRAQAAVMLKRVLDKLNYI